MKVSNVVVDGDELVVTVEGDDYEEVGSPAARDMAAKVASEKGTAYAMGFGAHVYPVDLDTDKPVEEPKADMRVVYRIDHRFSKRR